jgi:Mg2+ and Co2+ transporter CorA
MGYWRYSILSIFDCNIENDGQTSNYFQIISQFHSEPSPHPHNVRKRARQLKDFINITPDWYLYAILDDISDSFAPFIKQIDVEVDSIDDLVLLLRESEQSDMLRRIGSCRKRVMHLLRLLSSKAEVIRGLLNRSEDRLPEGTYRTQDAANVLMYLGGIVNDDRTKSEDHARYCNPDVILYFGDIQGMSVYTIYHYQTHLICTINNWLSMHNKHRSHHHHVAKFESLWNDILASA